MCGAGPAPPAAWKPAAWGGDATAGANAGAFGLRLPGVMGVFAAMLRMFVSKEAMTNLFWSVRSHVLGRWRDSRFSAEARECAADGDGSGQVDKRLQMRR